MAKEIFDFDYSWEVYIPVSKRKYGYYVIPVIYNDKFIARFEPTSVSESHSFKIKNWWWEENIIPTKKMLEAIEKEMKSFADFLGVECSEENIKKIQP